MGGDLLQIIYNFLINVFTDYQSGYIQNFTSLSTSIWTAFIRSLENNTSFFVELNNFATAYNNADSFYALFCWVLTWVIVIILILLLFRLFKWIFTLVFKLFRA